MTIDIKKLVNLQPKLLMQTSTHLLPFSLAKPKKLTEKKTTKLDYELNIISEHHEQREKL